MRIVRPWVVFGLASLSHVVFKYSASSGSDVGGGYVRVRDEEVFVDILFSFVCFEEDVSFVKFFFIASNGLLVSPHQ